MLQNNFITHCIMHPDRSSSPAPLTFEALRSRLRQTRGELPLFNYGPGIETLRANCETETGLKAPVQPVWTTLEAAE